MVNQVGCLPRNGHFCGLMSTQVGILQYPACTALCQFPHASPCLTLLNTPYWAVDLSGLFNWNTKQLFVYLTAEYTNSRGVRAAAYATNSTTGSINMNIIC